MRNRQLIAQWVYERGKRKNLIEFIKEEGKTYIRVNDYAEIRTLFGLLLKEIQRIKSSGNFEQARDLVENFGVKVNTELHKEVLERYNKLNLSPYKGFINPKYEAVTDGKGSIKDIKISYGEEPSAFPGPPEARLEGVLPGAIHARLRVCRWKRMDLESPDENSRRGNTAVSVPLLSLLDTLGRPNAG